MEDSDRADRDVSSATESVRTECVHSQAACWTVKNDCIVDEVNHLDSKDFLDKLKARDSQAWESVKSLIVEPVFLQRKYAEMAKEKSIAVGDAWGYLCLTMLEGERINLSRNPNKLKGWMQSYVRKFIREFFSEKEKRFVSAQTHFDKAMQEKGEVGGSIVEDPIARIQDAEQEVKRGEKLNFDEKSLIQDEFHKLWQKKPKQAYVLMLKMKEGLQTKDIKDLCKVSTSQSVDKLFERAKDAMAVALTGKHLTKRPKRRGAYVD